MGNIQCDVRLGEPPFFILCPTTAAHLTFHTSFLLNIRLPRRKLEEKKKPTETKCHKEPRRAWLGFFVVHRILSLHLSMLLFLYCSTASGDPTYTTLLCLVVLLELLAVPCRLAGGFAAATTAGTTCRPVPRTGTPLTDTRISRRDDDDWCESPVDERLGGAGGDRERDGDDEDE